MLDRFFLRRLSAKLYQVSALVPNVESQNPSKSFNDSCSFNRHLAKMLCRAMRVGACHRALPIKRNINVYVSLAKRNVTTDAASSHAEKEHVPEVSRAPHSESREII